MAVSRRLLIYVGLWGTMKRFEKLQDVRLEPGGEGEPVRADVVTRYVCGSEYTVPGGSSRSTRSADRGSVSRV
jgi:hypothetical protein